MKSAESDDVQAATAEREESQAVLFIAASEIDSNLFYACRFLSGDPIAYVEFQGRRILLVNELELGRARKEADVDEVVSLSPYEEELRRDGKPPNILDTVDLYFREKKIRRILVPMNFPVGHADRLRERGYRVESRDEPFYPQRTIKTGDEIARIQDAQAVTQEAMKLAIDLVRRSRISGDILQLDGEDLTAERVRREIHRFLLEEGYRADHTIVAGGDQACDPHVRGSGPLPAHYPIVIDIFPRSMETRYWGDLTRTVVKGRATPEVENLYQSVLQAQELALSLLGDGVDGKAVHDAVVKLFEERGHVTRERDGRMEGYFHSTGHGIGLDIHELPKIGRVNSTLRAGHVVTIEPGLYYPGSGGVRLEDLVVVTESGHRSLTSIPKTLTV